MYEGLDDGRPRFSTIIPKEMAPRWVVPGIEGKAHIGFSAWVGSIGHLPSQEPTDMRCWWAINRREADRLRLIKEGEQMESQDT